MPTVKQKSAPVKAEGSRPAKKAVKRKPLSAEEKRRRAEEARLEKERKAQEKKLRRARRKALLLTSLALSLVFVVLYYSFVAVSIATRDNGSEDALPVVVYRGQNNKADKRFEAEEIYFKGNYYLPLTVLEPYLAISRYGDSRTRSFSFKNSDNYATFYLNSCDAEICGVRVSLEGESFLKDDVLYLPVDFYRDRMNCFTFEKSTALAAQVFTFREENEPAFRVAADSPCDAVPYLPQYAPPAVAPEASV